MVFLWFPRGWFQLFHLDTTGSEILPAGLAQLGLELNAEEAVDKEGPSAASDPSDSGLFEHQQIIGR